MQEYKERVREYFSRKKGEGLILSPRNWMVVEKWEKMGIPLHIVIQGIDKTFENLCSSGLRQKKVHHLGYCEPEILNLWRAYRKKDTNKPALPVTQDKQKAVREYIDHKLSLLIKQVTQPGVVQPARGGLEVCDSQQESFESVESTLLQRVVRSMRLEEELANLRREVRSGLHLDMEMIEKRLQMLDNQLVQNLLVSLPARKREELLLSAEKQTRGYKNQMESSAYQETIQVYFIELLRARLGIHQLSLYQ